MIMNIKLEICGITTIGLFNCDHCLFRETLPESNISWSHLANLFKEQHGVPSEEIFTRYATPDAVSFYLDWVDKWLEFTKKERAEWEEICKLPQANCVYCQGTGFYDGGYYKENNHWDYYGGVFIAHPNRLEYKLIFNEEFKKDECRTVFPAQVFLDIAKQMPELSYSLLVEGEWEEMCSQRKQWRTPWRDANLFFDGNVIADLIWPYIILRKLEKAAENRDYATLIQCHI